MAETYSGCTPGLKLTDVMARKEIFYTTRHIQHLLDGHVTLGGFNIPIISRRLYFKDYVGTILTRLEFNRMNYSFPPGLYLIGKYSSNLPLIVTCNYKLTLDVLRKSLKRSGYLLLVLDTQGVNVWCAAGKGTFGTEELVYQLTKWKIKDSFNVDKVILPQLGASRMTPHIVKSLTGIGIVYGPVDVADLDDFIENNYQTSEESRRVKFRLKDRLEVSAIECVSNLKYLLPMLAFMFLWNAINNEFSFSLGSAVRSTLPWLVMMFIGTVLFPAMLPILPFKLFSLNGILLSIPAIAILILHREWFALENNPFQLTAWAILYLLYTAYLSLNFTGSTTFTSFSIVEYEVIYFKRFAKIAGIVAIILMFFSLGGL